MRRFLLVFLAVLAVSGCSSKFAYNNLDWLAYWYIDDYIELSDAQEAEFDVYLTQWLQWHRSQELGAYVAHLQSVKADILAGRFNEPDNVFQQFELASEHWYRLRDEIAPSLPPLAKKMTDEQVVYLFTQLTKENDERREELDESSEKPDDERMKSRVKDIEKQIKSRIGKLTDNQKTIIASFAPQFESTGYLWLSYREASQNAARKLLATRHTNPNFEQEFLLLLNNPEVYRSAELVEKDNANRRLSAAMTSQLAMSLTEKQKNKLIKEIDDMIGDLSELQK